MSEQELDRRLEEIAAKVAWQPIAKVLAEGQQQEDAELKAILDDLHTKLAEIYRAWEEKYGVPYPGNIEEWSELAVFAGIPADVVFKGDWTLRDAAPIIQGHLLKIRDWKPQPTTPAEIKAARKNSDCKKAGSKATGTAESRENLPVVTEPQHDDCVFRLLALYTNNVVDTRIREAAAVLRDTSLSANEKLKRIDKLIPIPPNVSSRQLGNALGITHQAITITDWWRERQKRQDEADAKDFEQRRNQLSKWR